MNVIDQKEVVENNGIWYGVLTDNGILKYTSKVESEAEYEAGSCDEVIMLVRVDAKNC